MKYQPQCVACAKRQGNRIYRFALQNGSEADPQTETQLNHELDQLLDHADPNLSPAEFSLMAIRTAQKHANSTDPFSKQKEEANQMALELAGDLQQKIDHSDDPLFTACQLAACGNIIDLGVHDTYDIHATIEKVLREGFRLNRFDQFRNHLETINAQTTAGHLLYLCDNAGEIVFDKLFMQEIKREFVNIHITAVVRKVPVLNDATRQDAERIGLDEVATVIDNGTEELGTVVDKSPPEFRQVFDRADLIISKGQANYETLSGRTENIYFILKAKCEVIAGSLGVSLYDAVMTQANQPQLVQINK